MKQKLLTLLTLLCLFVTGAWADGYYTPDADEVIILKDVYSANATNAGYSTHAAIAWGGTTSTNNKKAGDPNNNGAATSSNVPCYSVKGNGGGKNITVSITGVSKIIVYHESHSSRYVELRDGKKDGTLIGAGTKSTFYTEVELSGTTSYSIFLHGTGNGSDDQDIYVYAIKLIKYENKTVTSTVLTGININGNAWGITGLSGNAATITDEYAGPPTVQFVYTEYYNDYSSTTGKTEDVVAVKNGANYEAKSTVLTNNVTISFTNVSNVLFSMTDPTGPTDALPAKTSADLVATFSPGGSATLYNGHGTADNQMVVFDQVNLGGSGASYFMASFPAALAEGDIITSSNTDAGTFQISNTSSAGTAVQFPYTIPEGSDLIGKKAVYVFKSGTTGTTPTFSSFTITRPKTIDKQEFAGVKKGDVTLVETTDYTVSEGVITLTDAHKALLAPTDIKLINHITYDDATEEDKDVDVTFAENGEFFEGTATIGTATYTVKVPVDNTTPLLTLSATAGAINLNSYTPTGTVKVTVTGVNLENGTFNAPTAEGVEVTPATVEITDGNLNQEFTITSTATTAASTELVFAYTGAESKTYTLTYSKTAKRDVAQTDVTGAMIWDWTKSGGASIELTADTDPANGAEFLLAALPEITNDETFNSQALMVACQWPNRGTYYYFQGNTIKFNTTVPGTVQVWFQNTSNREDNAKNRRFLYINNVNQGVYTLRQDAWEDVSTYVPAGEVIINAFTGEETPAATMVRINKIVFTPLVVDVTDANYATYVTVADIDFTQTDGLQAYKVTSVNPTIKYEEVEKAPAGTPLLLKATSASYTLHTANPTDELDDVTDNLLKVADNTVGDGQTIYVLGKNPTDGKAVWGLLANGKTLSAGKAYLVIEGSNNAPFYSIEIGDDATTGINLNANDNLKFDQNAPMYNLAGQKVSNSYKGIVIVNGKKVVIK